MAECRCPSTTGCGTGRCGTDEITPNLIAQRKAILNRRASLVVSPEDWPWSSAAAHCGTNPLGAWLSSDAWELRWSSGRWRAYLQATQHEASRKAIRDSTYSGRPLGSPEFTRALERQEHRPLTRQKPGPKKRSVADEQQAMLSFDPL